MEFRIIDPHAMTRESQCSREPSDLTVSEKIELIKQLCPGIDDCVRKWLDLEFPTFEHFKYHPPSKYFSDYLAEQMEEKECQAK